jgi:molybdopterin-guanine dinucleotide biosynthesis protein A
VVRILGDVVSPIVVVAAREQSLPSLPDNVRIARDEHDAFGPLAGLAAGFAALRGKVEIAYATACDVPLLRPDFVRAVIEALGDHDLAIPRDGQYHHPLAAAYRLRLEQQVRDLIAANRLRPLFLLQESRAREIDVADLRRVDPGLESLRNANTPEDYSNVLRLAGLEDNVRAGN